jgi:hypothetical protein
MIPPTPTSSTHKHLYRVAAYSFHTLVFPRREPQIGELFESGAKYAKNEKPVMQGRMYNTNASASAAELSRPRSSKNRDIMEYYNGTDY